MSDYDAMLLSNTPTTVVTQATKLNDTVPAMTSSSEEEEALFEQLAADPEAAAADKGMPLAVAVPAPGMSPLIKWAGLALAGWLIYKSVARR